MKIGSMAGTNVCSGNISGGGMRNDPVSRNIQKKIADAQKRLRDAATDDHLPLEERTKKKQEIQQEIANLNQQLRQHQAEQKRQEQEAQEKAEKAAEEGHARQAETAQVDIRV